MQKNGDEFSMDKELKEIKNLLKEYYFTKKKIFYLNQKILDYNNLEKEGKTCEEILNAEKKIIEVYKRKIEDYIFIEMILDVYFQSERKILDDRLDYCQ